MDWKYTSKRAAWLSLVGAALIMSGCDTKTNFTPPEDGTEGGTPPQPKIVLPLCTADAGSEPWTVDPDNRQLSMLADINEGWKGSVPRKIGGNDHNKKFVEIGLKTFFPARLQHVDENNDTYESIALWVSEGTPDSTIMLKDFNNTDEYGLAQMVEMGGELYFRGWDNTNGYQIWKSNGTPNGTVRVSNIPGDPDDRYSNNIGGLRSLGDIVTFHAYTDNNGTELWKTDGTESGTQMIKDIYPGTSSSYPEAFKVIDGKLYFSAKDNTNGDEPWVSDGTTEGTHMIADIKEGAGSSSPYSFTEYNGEVYFSAYGEDENGTDIGKELYKTDGTEAGTVLVKDIYVGSNGSYPRYLSVYKEYLYFNARTDTGRTLWRTDGTDEGTVKVFDDVQWNDMDPEAILSVNEKLFFRADDSDYEYKLYMYDGIATEPTLVSTDDTSSYAHNFRVIDGIDGEVLAFMMETNDENETTALWVTDGTTTKLVKDQLCPRGYFDGTSPED